MARAIVLSAAHVLRSLALTFPSRTANAERPCQYDIYSRISTVESAKLIILPYLHGIYNLLDIH